MIESHAETASGTWNPPQCPFAIEYIPRVLDDIRLAVVDAFFSLPRGGAEIGGILLGRRENGRVVIEDHQALDCEHAFGPGFTLSTRDQNLLGELLKAADRHPSGLRPVGWYHSHTRSEIFLSEVDQEIHNRFFPQPWQIALVLKPHTFHPTRAGFFFRERDGSIQGKTSYVEFALEALPLRQVPPATPPPTPPAGPQLVRRERESRAPVITIKPEPETVPPPPVFEAAPLVEPVPPPPVDTVTLSAKASGSAAPERATQPERKAAPPVELEVRPEPKVAVKASLPTPAPKREAPPPPAPGSLIQLKHEPPPRFAAPPLATEVSPEPAESVIVTPIEIPEFAQVKPRLHALWTTLAIAMGLALGAGAYQTRAAWLPSARARMQAVLPAAGAPRTFGLKVFDIAGQLQIQWDRNSDVVRSGTAGVVEIVDGGPTQVLQLDPAHLQAGNLTYSRHGEKVDVSLILFLPDGTRAREVTSFLGKVPDARAAAPKPEAPKSEAPQAAAPKAPAEDPAVRKQREALLMQNSKLKSDLAAQAERAKRAEKALEDMRQRLRMEQRRRMGNQSPDK
jgi:proteasome lid subunit RPN8/RPN11